MCLDSYLTSVAEIDSSKTDLRPSSESRLTEAPKARPRLGAPFGIFGFSANPETPVNPLGPFFVPTETPIEETLTWKTN